MNNIPIFEFKDLPDTSTPYNAETFTAMQYKLLDSIYPIGSIIIQEESIDRSDFLGFVWERTLVGKVAVGIDSTDSDFNEVGKSGGSKEFQAHSHKVLQKNRSENEYQVVGSYSPSGGSYLGILATNGAATYDDAINYQIYTTTEGTGNAGNLQPYQVVAYWKRVA